MAGDGQLVQQGRNFLFYDAAYSSTNAMPTPDAFGTAWGGPFRDVGYSDGGIGFNVGTTYEDVLVDQEIDPVGVIASGRDIRITAQLAQFTIQNLQAAIGQGTTNTVAPSPGVRGYTDLAIGNTINVNYRTAGFEVQRSLGDQESIIGMVWRGQNRSSVQATFAANAKTIIPYEIQAFPDPNNANRVFTLRDIAPAA